MKRIPKEISEIHLSFTYRMSDTGISPCISFFSNHPTSIEWFVSWTAGNRLLKPLCSKMLDWLNFSLGEIIGLMHVLEKRYYQNKTQLHYNFGSVYFLFWCKRSDFAMQTAWSNYILSHLSDHNNEIEVHYLSQLALLSQKRYEFISVIVD